jgi:hypothetical protein
MRFINRSGIYCFKQLSNSAIINLLPINKGLRCEYHRLIYHLQLP